MAGLWIKLEHVTPDKPEIYRMAEQLEMDPDEVLGKCIRVWIWADQQAIDCNAVNVTESVIERVTSCAKFASALRAVGWLGGKNGSLVLPNFDKHNGATAKKRAKGQLRVQKHRESRNAGSVTKALPEIEIEKEIDIKKKAAPSKKFKPPSIGDVADYCRERHNSVDPEQFWDNYEANGWMRGKNKIKDWKACVRTWEKNGYDNRTNGTANNGRRLSAAEAREAANADAFRAVFGEAGTWGNQPCDPDIVLHEISGDVYSTPVGDVGSVPQRLSHEDRQQGGDHARA